MLKIDIIAVGRLRKGPFFDLSQYYTNRIKWSLSVYEIESKQTDPTRAQQEETTKILKQLNESAFIIALDERGDGLRSLDFAGTVENLQNSGERHIQFVIGGADGLEDEVKDNANLLLSFGQQTWPHLLVRVMLLEQIYRVQQILINHPYHRE